MTRRAQALFILAGIAAAGLIVIAVFAPRIAAGGWLLALCYVSAFPLGSLAWLMIHRLTGGRWGERLAPIFSPLALATPLLLLLLIPVFIALQVLFPWSHATGAVTPSVAAVYLNITLYIVRSLIALVGCSVLAFALTRSAEPSARLIAGIGLVFYAVAMSALALDWFLSVEPPFFSTSFGASLAITQLLAALALAALLTGEPPRTGDHGGLMLAVALGITYIDFMAVLVMWYGDLPARVFWFVERLRAPWLALAVLAFVAATLIPIALLMFAKVRQSRLGLRVAGGLILVGLAAYDAWIVAPAFGPAALGTALLAVIVMSGIIGGLLHVKGTRDFASGWRNVHGR